jgi:hypothetical protein
MNMNWSVTASGNDRWTGDPRQIIIILLHFLWILIKFMRWKVEEQLSGKRISGGPCMHMCFVCWIIVMRAICLCQAVSFAPALSWWPHSVENSDSSWFSQSYGHSAHWCDMVIFCSRRCDWGVSNTQAVSLLMLPKKVGYFWDQKVKG